MTTREIKATELHREAWNHPYGALASCEDCDFIEEGATPETIAAKARAHAREKNHITRVRNERITEYTPAGQCCASQGDEPS